MAEQDTTVSDDQPQDQAATAAPAEPGVSEPTKGDAKVPDFAELRERSVKRLNANPERLHGVSVPVWAELGRVEMLIGDLLQLGEGSVLRLDRAVGDPVDVISQGVKLARGEVIVVEDSFAVRIREVLSGE